MAPCARLTDLQRSRDRHQSTTHSAAMRLRHVANQMRRTAQNLGKRAHIVARQFQVEVANRLDLDVGVPQQAQAAHAEKGSVSVDP